MKAWIFPGQGSQTPGMGADLYRDSESARAIFEQAAVVLAEGFLDTLFHGADEAVNDTRVAQPGLLTVEAALTAHLKAHGHVPAACAGHSLGEISALVAAEVVTFEDAIRFTRERARLMSENIPAGGMAAVMGLDVEGIVHALDGVDAVIANYNSPAQIIISGTHQGIEEATGHLKDAGAKRVMPLKVSGPFHSPHMRPAAEAFAAVLKDVPFEKPRYPFFSSVSGTREDDPVRIKELLSQQLYSPVRWMQTMTALQAEHALEVGPGGVLRGLAKRIEDAPAVEAAGTLEALAALS